jgi:hypothetical protein
MECIDRARGSYLARMDADDIVIRLGLPGSWRSWVFMPR